MPGITTLSGQLQVKATWSAQNPLTGADYNPLTQTGNIQKSQSFGTASNNAQSGGADEFVSYIVSIAASGTATVDLTSLTNILQQTSVSLAQIKGYMIRLLSTADDSTLGTNANQVVIGNAAANQQNLNLSTNATFRLQNGEWWSWGTPKTAGLAVAGGTKNLLITNSDTALAAKVQLTFFGCTS